MSAEDYIDSGKRAGTAIAEKFFTRRQRGDNRNVEVHLTRADLAGLLAVAYAMGAEHGEKVGRGRE